MSNNEFNFNRTPDMFKDVSEVFLIAQSEKQHEDLSGEEHDIVKQLGFEYVNFASGSGIYKNKDEAIMRKLAVISAIA